MQSSDTPRTDAILEMPSGLARACRRVTWQHYQRLLDAGIPSRDLARLRWGVVMLQGREMIVTDDLRVRAYLTGAVMALMPGRSNAAPEE